MRYKCPYHQDKINTISFSSLMNGSGCRYCAIEANSKENHSNWKGEISPLMQHLRSKLLQWKKDSMKQSNYQCILTKSKKNWEIHHLYSFDLILQELFEETDLNLKDKISDYTNEELKLLEDKCLEIHYRYPFGACLRRDVHDLFHSLYGKGNNTPEQFEEFKQRWDNGEFEDVIKEVV